MTIFTKIINGEIPCYKVAEDDQNLAFLDINPLTPGHTIVIPKIEIDKIYDLPEDRLTSLVKFAQKIAQKIDKNIDCIRVGITVVGIEVPHAHIHLIPMVKGPQDINFENKRVQLTPEEMTQIARKINA